MITLALHRHATARPIRLFRRLWTALEVGRSRARLAQLDDHMLRDIGLDREQAQHEADRAAWDVPAHWRR